MSQCLSSSKQNDNIMVRQAQYHLFDLCLPGYPPLALSITALCVLNVPHEQSLSSLTGI